DEEKVETIMTHQMRTLETLQKQFNPTVGSIMDLLLDHSRQVEWKCVVEKQEQSVFQAWNVFGSKQQFQRISENLINICLDYTQKTGVQWVEYNLTELKIEAIVYQWCNNILFNNSTLLDALVQAQLLSATQANMKFQIKGFIVRELVETHDTKQTNVLNKAFVYQEYHVADDNGVVSQVHRDDSDITLHLCLGQTFDGGCLSFTFDTKTPSLRVPHQVGCMHIFRGDMLHHIEYINSGVRVNLVLFISFV
ncbi:hypothetical protein RFI_15563, partial [Reticulomyxa filosa]